ncbi:MAG: SpoIIE family protein phosphatase [Synergistaceae bacterium]|nr:SpoIIE family protein phosphatase [Synergistaceae bacterium]
MTAKNPIGRKVRRLVVNVALSGLLVTSAIAIVSMHNIREKNKEVLITQMETSLYNTIKDKAKFADSELGKYLEYANMFADYVNVLYANPSKFVPNEVLPPRRENAGRFVMLRTLLNEQTKYESLKEECSLLGNIEQVWIPFLKAHSEVSIFLATKSGFLMTYDAHSDLSLPREGQQEVYYDFTGSSWYLRCSTTETTGFTDIYDDHYGRGKMMTAFAPFYDGGGNFAGAMGLDILITDLYRAIVAIDMGRGAYAFIVDHMGKVISSSDNPNAEAAMLSDDPDITPQIAREILAGRTSVALSRSETYYAYTPIRSTGWKLCIKMPRSLVLSPLSYIYENVEWAILLLLLSFVIIWAVVRIAGRKFSERLTAPIRRLGHDVDKISSGNLEHRAEITSDDEIGELARHFNDMTASLREYIAYLADVTAEKERIGAELSIATQIQADMLPKIIPPFLNHEAFDISATMYPAKEVGGDFYDFFMIDDNHLALVMADVSGKGVPAALFMVVAKTLIKNRAMMGGTPGEILHDVNNQLCEGNDSSLFVTVWLGILELPTGKVTASNAGHEPPAIRRAGGKYELFGTAQNVALAIMEDMEFSDDEFKLEHLDTIYLYTDGVTEATNTQRQLYGTDRMIDELNSTRGAPADEVLTLMNRSVREFTGDVPQFDDVTMLCLQFFGSIEMLTVEADTGKLHDVIAFVDEYLEKWGCPASFISEIELAVEEIFVNIASYAYKDKEAGGMATISIRHLGKDVEIIFTDSGTPYNPLEHSDPDITLDADERDIGGLGIYIVKQSMNSVSYEYIGDNNVFRMRKDIHDTED